MEVGGLYALPKTNRILIKENEQTIQIPTHFEIEYGNCLNSSPKDLPSLLTDSEYKKENSFRNHLNFVHCKLNPVH